MLASVISRDFHNRKSYFTVTTISENIAGLAGIDVRTQCMQPGVNLLDTYRGGGGGGAGSGMSFVSQDF